MKYYSLRYCLMEDNGGEYREIANFPSFDWEKDALKYWEDYKKIHCVCPNNMVLIRREIRNLLVKAL